MNPNIRVNMFFFYITYKAQEHKLYNQMMG